MIVKTVITSATKGLAASVISVLESIYKNRKLDKFAGETTYFNAANAGVGLPTVVIGDEKADAFDRFDKFTKEQYESVFAKLVDGSIQPIRTIKVEDPTGYATADELATALNLTKVVVTTRQ